MKYTYLFVIGLFTFYACKKEATVNTAQVSDYISLQPGKFIHYRLDSMRFINFGQQDTIISYHAKDVVDAELTDGSGRPTFRILRYLRNFSNSQEDDYRLSLTYFITPTRESIEVSENNLHFQKLRLPVTNGFNWHGNSYLPVTPYYELYEFSNDEDIHLWDYSYENVNESVEIENNVYDSTVTVLQVADSSNVPIEFPDGFAYKNYWLEQWGKNVGLLYREIEMWEYQPPFGNNPGFRTGFGLRMTIIDHN